MALGGPRTVLKRASGAHVGGSADCERTSPMPTDTQGTAGEPAPLPEPPGMQPSPVSAPGAEAPPVGQVVTDTWAEAADPTGTVKATKDMPEPDSLGG